MTTSSFCGPKMGFFPHFGGSRIFFLVSMVQMVHNIPLDLLKKQNRKIFIFKKVIKVPPPQNDKLSFCGKNLSFCGGVGTLHFLSKDFKILDLDPPNNPTSQYGACHFGYNNNIMRAENFENL